MKLTIKTIGYLSVFIGEIFLILVIIVPAITVIGYPEAEALLRFYGSSFFGVYAYCVLLWMLVPYIRRLPYSQVTFIGVGASMATVSIVIEYVQQGMQIATESLMIPFILFTPTPYILLMIVGFILHGLKR
ncbi:hypothetical protein A3C89_03195 [Candidatus Kaiserbacteria bacterium RIFCSPHIGHO2_02_FULL_50_50]|uniref:Uncharacterized protein n=1 Tax=Candidatus Kaiserbacteria bacterium RIFCSPHIGHO2_02_FULL_50_50 TaxID=1798492 RepID=A0A1F6DFY5_9BACT|nr:MAG: hypothetical protein A3C89_03195 [Candidatus Kaiserbacteria bacterium RIFCSPHIGHO2_02_FULL_50_50]OGG88107.1 MAG: hypothetical protein A3G62_02440 [Candidatus Kaiserbacteria bacterium RIFCSPLOWO2_12_FULL_50_10]